MLPKVVNFLLLPVYAAYLDPEAYGVVDVAGTIAIALAVVMRVALPGALARFYFDFGEGPGLKDYVSTLSLFILLNGAAWTVAALILGYFLTERVFPGFSFFPFAVITIATSLFSLLPELQQRLLQAREQARYTAKLNLTRAAVLTATTVLLVVLLGLGALGMLSALLLTAVVFNVQAFFYLRPLLFGRIVGAHLWASLRYSTGVVGGHLIAAAFPMLLLSILTRRASLAEVGLLAVAARFSSLLTVFNGAFSRALSPVYFAARTRSDEPSRLALERTVHISMAASVALCLGVALLGPPLVLLLLPGSYAVAAGLIPVLTIARLTELLTGIFAQEPFYQKRTRLLPVMGLLTLAFGLPAAWVWVPEAGALGAAWAQVLGGVANAIGLVWLAHRMSPLRQDWLGVSKFLVVGLLGLGLGSWLRPEAPWIALALGLGVLAVFCVFAVCADRQVNGLVLSVLRRLRRR